MTTRPTFGFARACALVLAVALPQVAAAQSAQPEQPAQPLPPTVNVVEQARTHFQKGVAYYVDGDLAGALGEFQRAYALQPTYRLLYNFGQVAFEQRDYAAAERYFRQYLDGGGDEIDAQRRTEVEDDLAQLKGRIADVRVHSNLPDAKIFIDDQPIETAALSAPIRVSAGRRSLRAESAGHATVTRVIDIVGGDAISVELAFAPPVAPATSEPRAVDSPTTPALWTGIATGVLGVGTGAMAYWTNSDDNDYADAVERRTSRAELDALASSTKRKAFITDIMLGATVVTAGLTVFLLLTDDEPREQRPATPAIQLGVGSVRASF